ncbi:hypothetical protein WN944_010593 [Citrus x changshan-huyou]|uniref:Uncharacterized protein n=4 Tax=Citrus TaxID=2706 RepID=A0ACB8N4D3_CITSI|nr:hypothetical protein KPL71_004144 [Citrus sinensis]
MPPPTFPDPAASVADPNYHRSLHSPPRHTSSTEPRDDMVCFCFLVDQTRKVHKCKPAAGICSRCGGGASVADMKTATRFCHVPFYWKSWRAIICTFCGAVLKSYQ